MPNRVALITGTSRGIGRFLVEHFLQEDYSVVGCSRSPVEWELEGYEHFVADVTDEKHVKAMMSGILRAYGRLDVAINNAGMASMNHFLLTPMATVDRIIKTNFYGTFLVCRESAKLMMRRRYGRIVNVGTVAVPMRLAGEALYAASKSAIVCFTQILAHELGEFGITCNIVGPTPIETDLIHSVPKEKIDRVVSRLAIKRLGHFEDVANVIDFFVKPESEYVTGQMIYLGGM